MVERLIFSLSFRIITVFKLNSVRRPNCCGNILKRRQDRELRHHQSEEEKSTVTTQMEERKGMKKIKKYTSLDTQPGGK